MTAESAVPRYVKEAIASFHSIMASNRKGAMEKLNRVNKGELFVLNYLASSRDTVLPTELSGALKSSNARISVLLGVLEKKGHIERSIDTEDRRNVLVSITATGRERVAREMRKMRGCMLEVFTGMGEEDTREFIRLVKVFLTLMYKHMPDGQGKDC